MEGIITRKGGDGIDTSSATATSSDIRVGKTAYANGQLVQGSLAKSNFNNLGNVTSTSVIISNDESKIVLQKTLPQGSQERIIGAGDVIEVSTPLSEFGTATASDVASGKTFTSSSGLEVWGSLVHANSLEVNKTSVADSNNYYNSYSFAGTNNGKKILNDNAPIKVAVRKSEFGNATASDVLSGKTFTSSSGISITGTGSQGADTSDATATSTDIKNGKTAYVNGYKVTGTYVPLDTSDATATAANIDSGKTAYVNGAKVIGTSTKVDTADADATSSDISSGKTAYVNGVKVTGTSTGTETLPAAEEINNYNYISGVGSKVGSVDYGVYQSRIIRNGVTETALFAYSEVDDHYLNKKTGTLSEDGEEHKTYIEVAVPLEDYVFGDATASDVVSGKTFTSASGLNVTGTGSLGTDTTDATATASDITTGKTAYVNGSKVTGTKTEPEVIQTITNMTGDGTNITNFNTPRGIYQTNATYNGEEKKFLTLNAYPLNPSGSYTIGNYTGEYNGHSFSDYTSISATAMLSSSTFGNAETGDVASGVTFTSSNGLKLTGTGLIEQHSDWKDDDTVSSFDANGNAHLSTVFPALDIMEEDVANTIASNLGVDTGEEVLVVEGFTIEDTIAQENSTMRVAFDGYQLGEAEANQVLSGVTFSSVNGLSIEGTYVPPTAPGLSTLTSDATASAADIASGKTAYVAGSKITGTAVIGKVKTYANTVSFSSTGWNSSSSNYQQGVTMSALPVIPYANIRRIELCHSSYDIHAASTPDGTSQNKLLRIVLDVNPIGCANGSTYQHLARTICTSITGSTTRTVITPSIKASDVLAGSADTVSTASKDFSLTGNNFTVTFNPGTKKISLVSSSGFQTGTWNVKVQYVDTDNNTWSA